MENKNETTGACKHIREEEKVTQKWEDREQAREARRFKGKKGEKKGEKKEGQRGALTLAAR